jgi:hypothetical protein
MASHIPSDLFLGCRDCTTAEDTATQIYNTHNTSQRQVHPSYYSIRILDQKQFVYARFPRPKENSKSDKLINNEKELSKKNDTI